jgi:hypothetical protein
MKTLLKLIVAVIVVNASVRAGKAALNYYQFKESAQQAVLFGAGISTDDIRERILERADELGLPVNRDNVTVGRESGRTWADASYSQSVELFPNQKYPVDFSFSVEGYSMVIGR